MRETRTSGSEGGGTDWSSIPLSLRAFESNLPACVNVATWQVGAVLIGHTLTSSRGDEQSIGR